MIKKIKVNIKDMIYNYPSQYEEGLTDEEIEKLLTWFPTIHKDKFQEALLGNSCMMIEGDLINCHHDVLKAFICGFENRSLTLTEWD